MCCGVGASYSALREKEAGKTREPGLQEGHLKSAVREVGDAAKEADSL